jgi:transposase-like protein
MSGTTAESRWREVLERQRASGLSVAAFCRRHGLSAASLYAWRRRLSVAAPGPAFVEAKLTDVPAPAEAAGVVEVWLRGGRRVRVGSGFDPQLLKELVAALEGMPTAGEGMS